MQEVGADRAVTILEASQHNTFSFVSSWHRLRSSGHMQNPKTTCVPDTTRTFTDRARLEDVGSATGTADYRLGLEHVVVTRADIKAHGTGNTVLFGLIHQEVSHADAVENLVR